MLSKDQMSMFHSDSYLCLTLRRAGTLANNEDPDEMLHYAAFHQCLHCLLK